MPTFYNTLTEPLVQLPANLPYAGKNLPTLNGGAALQRGKLRTAVGTVPTATLSANNAASAIASPQAFASCNTAAGTISANFTYLNSIPKISTETINRVIGRMVPVQSDPGMIVCEWDHYGDQVEVQFTCNTAGGFRILVDGVPVTTIGAVTSTAWPTQGIFNVGATGVGALSMANGGGYRVLLDFGGVRATRTIRFESFAQKFTGCTAGPSDYIWISGATLTQGPIAAVFGDSFTGFANTNVNTLRFNGWACNGLGEHTGWNMFPMGIGGSGYLAPGTGINLVDRLAPPRGYTVAYSGTGGTWALSVTAAGSTQTATGLAWNITAANLQTAIIALSNVGVGEVEVTGGTGFYLVLFRAGLNIVTTTVTIDGTGLSGQLTGLTPSATPYLGDLLPVLPANGTPIVAIMAMGYNDAQAIDSGTTGYTAATVTANAEICLNVLLSNAQVGEVIVVGPFSSGTPPSTGRTQLDATLAAMCATYNVPYIIADLYITGTPGVNGTAMGMIGADNTHPTPIGGQHLADRLFGSMVAQAAY